MRADARRNYERILEVARKAFAAHGVEASLDDIARTAGVGPGTLYRHFPTRQALLERVLQGAQEAVIEAAEAAAQAADPYAALTAWLRRLARHSLTYRGLAEALIDTVQDPSSPLYETCRALHKSGQVLFARAQDAGAIRTDVSADDVFGLVCGTAWVADHTVTTDKEAEIDRLLAIVMAGISTPDH